MIRLARLGVALAAAAVACSGASGIVETPAGAHLLKLGPYVVPPARTVGLIATARINGGPSLRLLLDSGADSIVLDGKAARKSGCLGGSDLDLVGAGGPAAVVRRVRAQTVQIGDLTLADAPVLVAGHSIGDGIQGVLPLSVFSGFLIRLDIPGKVLQLLPYPAARTESGRSINAIASNRLLFVKATVNEVRDGYFLLDTGASYSAISQTVARELKISETLSERVSLQGGTAAMDAALVGSGIRLRLPERDLDSGPVVAIDLSASSAYHHFEIAGLIGYPALSRSVLLISYRDRLIHIEPR